MSKGNTFESELLTYIFVGTAVPGAGGTFYVSLHTASPGEAGVQTTSECGYTSYARVSAAFSVTGSVAKPTATITFPTATGGSETATHAAVGTAATGDGKILWYGPIEPSGIVIISGTVPELLDTSTITED